MIDYEPLNPAGGFHPARGVTALYQPVGAKPEVARILTLDRAANTAVVTFPDRNDSRQHTVRLDHLRKLNRHPSEETTT